MKELKLVKPGSSPEFEDLDEYSQLNVDGTNILQVTVDEKHDCVHFVFEYSTNDPWVNGKLKWTKGYVIIPWDEIDKWADIILDISATSRGNVMEYYG